MKKKNTKLNQQSMSKCKVQDDVFRSQR